MDGGSFPARCKIRCSRDGKRAAKPGAATIRTLSHGITRNRKIPGFSGAFASWCGRVRERARLADDPDGIRTRVAALKGPCPRPLDDGASRSNNPKNQIPNSNQLMLLGIWFLIFGIWSRHQHLRRRRKRRQVRCLSTLSALEETVSRIFSLRTASNTIKAKSVFAVGLSALA